MTRPTSCWHEHSFKQKMSTSATTTKTVAKKSACIRIGPRFNVNCCNIVTREWCEFAWINVVRYLGIYVQSSSSFKCSLDSAKCSFYQPFNAVFGKIGRTTSHEVTSQLIKSKCFPVLYYSLEACPLRKSRYNSSNYVINSTCRRIFNMGSQEVVDICLDMFNCFPAEGNCYLQKIFFKYLCVW